MGYKLIALDIDGTIRSNDYPLSDRTKSAIASVMDAGAIVTVATGRMFDSALKSTEGLNITSPIASYQGALVSDPVTREVLWQCPLAPQMSRAALDALAPWGMEVVAYYGHEVYVSELTPWLEGYGVRNEIKVNVVDDLGEFAENELTRLVVHGDDDSIEALEQELKAKFDSELYVTRSLSYFCEILHPEAGKDKALTWLCKHLGIDERETIAFGNGYNDVQMLEWAGLGVAIGGAVPEVIQVADKIAPPIEEDGAAQVLEDLLAKRLIG